MIERPKSALQAGHGPIAVAPFLVEDPELRQPALVVPATFQAQDPVGAQLEIWQHGIIQGQGLWKMFVLRAVADPEEGTWPPGGA